MAAAAAEWMDYETLRGADQRPMTTKVSSTASSNSPLSVRLQRRSHAFRTIHACCIHHIPMSSCIPQHKPTRMIINHSLGLFVTATHEAGVSEYANNRNEQQKK